MAYQRLKGTLDFFETNAIKLRYVENVVRNVISKYDFSEIVTPIFENTDVFVRSSGEGSDIVNKEMYTFTDKGNRSITLRPEGTAAVVRCFLENKMYVNSPIKKLFYFGPMFRYERPQIGRYRQFIQFGIEVFGQGSSFLDVEVISSCYNIFRALGLKNIKLKINTIGDFKSRDNYAKELKKYFSDKIDYLCDDCKNRFIKNPMRILDCKVDSESDIIKNAPKITDSLTEESIKNFNATLKLLEQMEIPYLVDTKLVRGLDYYTDIVFEFIIDTDDELKGLAIGAGGKYADLVKSFGGPDIPGIGYAFGVERIISLMDKMNLFDEIIIDDIVTIVSLDYDSKIYGMKLANILRMNNICVEFDYNNFNLKPQFKLAERVKSRYIIIIGEEERNNNLYTIKDTVNNTQYKCNIDDLIKKIKGGKA